MELDSESEAAFLATYNRDSAESNDSGDGDWFDEVVRLNSEELDWFSEGKVDESISSTHDMHSPNDLSLPDASDNALPAAESADPHKTVTHLFEPNYMILAVQNTYLPIGMI